MQKIRCMIHGITVFYAVKQDPSQKETNAVEGRNPPLFAPRRAAYSGFLPGLWAFRPSALVCRAVPPLLHPDATTGALPALCRYLTREDFRKALRGKNRNASDGLAVESAEMGFVAGEEGLASVLDCGGEHRPVFFW